VEVFVKDKLNIYTGLKISTLDRLKNHNKNNENKQYCGYFVDYPKKSR